MKKILVTGKNSFVGNSFAEWVSQFPNKYHIEFISMRDNEWRSKSFCDFDVILHVAGIAHVSTDPKMEGLYYKVNRDLTIELAKKAKDEGVKHFIFMSSIIVYGDGTAAKKVITKETLPNPTNFYGKSKLQAEVGIQKQSDEKFRVCCIRPPMIYGKGSRGNYLKLVQLAKKIPFFPDFMNERSMLHIENLTEFIKILIDSNDSGVFFPQNEEYVRTCEMVKIIARQHGKNIWLTKAFNFFIKLTVSRFAVVNKVFGNLVYDKEMSRYEGKSYWINDLEGSIKKSR